MKFPYIRLIKPGLERFAGTKKYLATADVDNASVNMNPSIIDYENRESRANMQPIKNSVWFAKMKNSVKHIFLSDSANYLTNEFVFSTGFCGIKCDTISFEYVLNYVSLPYFEITKDKLAHGATQEAINNEDLTSLSIHLPPKDKLANFHQKTEKLYRFITTIEEQTYRLIQEKEKLLPLLINGQLQ